MLTPDWLPQLWTKLLIAAVLAAFGWLLKRWYAANEARIDRWAYRKRQEAPIVSLSLVLVIGAIVGAAVAATIWFTAVAVRPPEHRLTFAMLREPSVSGDVFQVGFMLTNSSHPPDEINNVFGTLWVDAEFVTAVTIPPARGVVGTGRLEWDVRTEVLPKGSVFALTEIRFRAPPAGREFLIGAQFVSKQTDKKEYLWRVVSDGKVPRFVTEKNADSDLK
jgi:hypothetical protein